MDARIGTFTSQKFRFFSFLAMALLVYVHGYDLHERYLQPWSFVDERLTFTTFVEYLLSNGLLRFRIPILFIISGYLFAFNDRQPYGARIRKRVRTLLVPYVLWSAIGLVFTLVLQQWEATAAIVRSAHLQPFGDVPVARLGIWQLWVSLVVVPTPFQLWFLRCLFVYNLAYPWIRTAVLRAPRATFGVLGVLWVMTFGAWIFEGEGLLFFTLGVWLCKTEQDIETRPSWFRPVPTAVLWVGLAALKTWLAFFHDPRLPTGPASTTIARVVALLFLHKTVVALGMVVMWYGIDDAVRWAMARRWFVWLSGFSFMIYALHVPLLTYAMIWVFPLVEHVPHYRLLVYLLLPTTVTAVCVLTGAALRGVAPKLYGVLTGGRGFAA
ncbi:MAG: acyltransferase [Gemmatimonadetes bacterium]|nr:acyltransferase [Gemmatimonadota bacterium]MBI3567954.1 acyltransferase [Gemmatimonadota bacterium]